MASHSDNNHPLREWLRVFVQSPQIRDKLYQARIEKLWSDRMGQAIVSYTRKIKLDGNILILYIDSAPLKQELSIMKEKIMEMMNEGLGETYIREVRVL